MPDDRPGLAERPVLGTHVTYTELHATLLGLTVGAFCAYAVTVGARTVGVGVGALFVGTALGVDAGGRLTHGDRVLQREPWYGLVAFVLVGALVLAVW